MCDGGVERESRGAQGGGEGKAVCRYESHLQGNTMPMLQSLAQTCVFPTGCVLPDSVSSYYVCS